MIRIIKEKIKNKLGVGVYKVNQEHNAAIRTLYAEFIKSGDLVFDIGANVGNRIVPLLEIGANILAVEPQHKCIQTLQIRFGNKIKIEPKGVDAKVGSMIMHISDNTVLSTFSEEWIEKTKDQRFKGSDWQHTQTIEMTTFDELIEKYGKPRFAKIDVEGYEKNVLSGLTYAVDFISLEYAVPEQTESLKECLDLLKNINDKAKCNYCVGENMKWALNSWISVDEMKKMMESPAFIATEFGDIYISNVK
jgi:FkbM family methyltransferase